MRIHIKSVSTVCICTISFILATFSGLAGSFSVLVAFFLPCFIITSLIHLILSWTQFSFHQNFSNDHPHKGESVSYHLSVTNEGFFPICEAWACFAQTGPLTNFPQKVYIPTFPHTSATYTEEIHCSYRGTYTVGVTEIHLKDVLGLIEIIETIEVRIFYVYPEIIPLSSLIEHFAQSEGSTQISQIAREMDVSIFESIAPLRAGESADRIAWKHWAARGIPVKIISAFSGSAFARIILDLFPNSKDTKEDDLERLACEDTAISIAFSLCARFIELGIPSCLYQGSGDEPLLMVNHEDFNLVYKQSTGILFNDTRIPLCAFNEENTTILVTTRPLVTVSKENNMDLFSLFTERIQNQKATHLFSCPPASLFPQEKKNIETLSIHRDMSFSTIQLSIIQANASKEEIYETICP